MFGRAIRYVRKQKGLTLKELGRLVGDGEEGLTHSTISRYERGERQPSPATLRKIADALDTTLEELRDIDNRLRGSDPRQGVMQEAKAAVGYVTNKSDISAWRDRVVRTPGLGDFVQILLLSLPAFIDRDIWAVTITIEQFVRDTGRDPELVEDHWQEMIDTDYVEAVGEVEWVLRLKFP